MFEVQTYTICDGWINCWTDGDGNKIRYKTEQEAQADIAEFLDDINTEIQLGLRAEDEGYDEEEYRVVPVLRKFEIVCKLSKRIMQTRTEAELKNLLIDGNNLADKILTGTPNAEGFIEVNHNLLAKEVME
jgi:hypothetical protein